MQTKIGNGSVFQVFLPVYGGDTPSGEIPKMVPDSPKGSERILLVDDETHILDTFKAILENQGYRVSTFNNGEAALKKFMENPKSFDLVITDMTMPQMTGDRLSRDILSIRADMPIILCTGYHEKFTEKEAIRLGVRKISP